ncbi:MAG: hydroxyproline-2-epimerase [Planctomycetaceae bacterium]|nr:MAG: hydroxyproline-2-epimerase [Planctomycetaceae bacterium]
MIERLWVIDTHTEGEPTRIVIAGGPDLGGGSVAERLERMRRHFDRYRSAAVNEPRGSDVLVGAWLTPPSRGDCQAGVIFFNNVGYLGMCGHGTMGVAAALGYLGRWQAGDYALETPVGVVRCQYDGAHRVTIQNVPSWVYKLDVTVAIPGIGVVTGDIAWGGNWFFIVSQMPTGYQLSECTLTELTDLATRIRRALQEQGITGAEGQEIDHIELEGPPLRPDHHGRHFVLCPGLSYDRSPCGTGTSAKLAVLAARGELAEGEVWWQESIVGTVFAASYRRATDCIIPQLTGSAYVTAETTLLIDHQDPLAWGFQGEQRHRMSG